MLESNRIDLQGQDTQVIYILRYKLGSLLHKDNDQRDERFREILNSESQLEYIDEEYRGKEKA